MTEEVDVTEPEESEKVPHVSLRLVPWQNCEVCAGLITEFHACIDSRCRTVNLCLPHLSGQRDQLPKVPVDELKFVRSSLVVPCEACNGMGMIKKAVE